MQTSEQIDQLATALAKAQAEMTPAIKDKVVKGSFSYAYADLATVIEAAHATLAKHGLSISTSFRVEEWGTVMVMALMHASGQRIVSEFPIRPVKQDPQAVGSAISYARRYAMMSLINLPTADDDGAAGSGRNDDAYHQAPQSRRNTHGQTREQLPEAWGGVPRGPQSVPRGRGRPPKAQAPQPVETSELFQEVMETIREATGPEDLATASQLAMDLEGEEQAQARAAWRARNEGLKAAASRSDAARDSIKASLTLPKPA